MIYVTVGCIKDCVRLINKKSNNNIEDKLLILLDRYCDVLPILNIFFNLADDFSHSTVILRKYF